MKLCPSVPALQRDTFLGPGATCHRVAKTSTNSPFTLYKLGGVKISPGIRCNPRIERRSIPTIHVFGCQPSQPKVATRLTSKTKTVRRMMQSTLNNRYPLQLSSSQSRSLMSSVVRLCNDPRGPDLAAGARHDRKKLFGAKPCPCNTFKNPKQTEKHNFVRRNRERAHRRRDPVSCLGDVHQTAEPSLTI